MRQAGQYQQVPSKAGRRGRAVRRELCIGSEETACYRVTTVKDISLHFAETNSSALFINDRKLKYVGIKFIITHKTGHRFLSICPALCLAGRACAIRRPHILPTLPS